MTHLKRFPVFCLTLLLAVFVGCASTAKQEGTGEYFDDTFLTTKVKAAIFNEPALKSTEMNVETFKGVVQLSGVCPFPGRHQQGCRGRAGRQGREVGQERHAGQVTGDWALGMIASS